MKKILTALLVLSATSLGAAANITAREISASMQRPKGVEGNLDFTDHTHTRELRTEVGLTPEELASGKVFVEARYVGFIGGVAANPIERGGTAMVVGKLSMATTHKIVFSARPGARKSSYWAARVIIDGKAVAWVAENDKALAWLKALPVASE